MRMSITLSTMLFSRESFAVSAELDKRVDTGSSPHTGDKISHIILIVLLSLVFYMMIHVVVRTFLFDRGRIPESESEQIELNTFTTQAHELSGGDIAQPSLALLPGPQTRAFRTIETLTNIRYRRGEGLSGTSTDMANVNADSTGCPPSYHSSNTLPVPPIPPPAYGSGRSPPRYIGNNSSSSEEEG
jgi:hypothetical protein